MNENLKAFLQKASEDSELKEKVTAITGSLSEAKEKLIKVAEDYGYSFTVEDVDAVESGKDQLSNEDLLAISGGVMEAGVLGRMFSSCVCILAGGGCADEYQKHCACVVGGVGLFTSLGMQEAEMGFIDWCGDSSAKVAMYCPLAGGAAMP